jgi:hypothetical protein
VTVLTDQRSTTAQAVTLSGVLFCQFPYSCTWCCIQKLSSQGRTLLGARMIAIQDVQTGACLRIPHPATTPHTHTPQPPIVRSFLAPHTGTDRDRAGCGAAHRSGAHSSRSGQEMLIT